MNWKVLHGHDRKITFSFRRTSNSPLVTKDYYVDGRYQYDGVINYVFYDINDGCHVEFTAFELQYFRVLERVESIVQKCFDTSKDNFYKNVVFN